MSTHIFELGDSEGNSFRISIVVPFRLGTAGSWRTLNKGYIRHNSGATQPTAGFGGDDQDLLLFSSEGTWGIHLDDYQDFWGVNDQGTGVALQPWVLTLKPGTISWSLVD